MPSPTNSNDLLRKVYAFSEKQLAAGMSAQKLKETLLAKGLTVAIADQVVDTLAKPTPQAPTKLDFRYPWFMVAFVWWLAGALASKYLGAFPIVGMILFFTGICAFVKGISESPMLARTKKLPPRTATRWQVGRVALALFAGGVCVETFLLILPAVSAAKRQVQARSVADIKPAGVGDGHFHDVATTRIWVPDQWEFTTEAEAEAEESTVVAVTSPDKLTMLGAVIYKTKEAAYEDLDPHAVLLELARDKAKTWRAYRQDAIRPVSFHNFKACAVRMSGQPRVESPEYISMTVMIATDESRLFRLNFVKVAESRPAVDDVVVDDVFRWVTPKAD